MSRYSCSIVPIYSISFACRLITGRIILARLVYRYKAGCWPFWRFGIRIISVYVGIYINLKFMIKRYMLYEFILSDSY